MTFSVSKPCAPPAVPSSLSYALSTWRELRPTRRVATSTKKKSSRKMVPGGKTVQVANESEKS